MEWKVENLKYDNFGHCDLKRNDNVICGYCDICKVIGEAAVLTGKWEDIENWQKENWKNTTLTRMRIKELRQKELKKLCIKTGNSNNLKHQFITIGLPKDYSLCNMVKLIENIQKNDLYGLKDSVASYEWYSDKNPDGGNLHIHMLVLNNEKQYRPHALAKRLAKKFGIQANFVDVINSNDDFNNRLRYICGVKNDIKKQVHCDQDDLWREENCLPRLSIGFHFSLRLMIVGLLGFDPTPLE